MHVISLFNSSLYVCPTPIGKACRRESPKRRLGDGSPWPAGYACNRVSHLPVPNTVARTVELDSSQNRGRCRFREATLPLSTQPLELLRGLVTGQGRCQSWQSPLACRLFS